MAKASASKKTQQEGQSNLEHVVLWVVTRKRKPLVKSP